LLVTAWAVRYKIAVGKLQTRNDMKKIICVALLVLVGCFAMPSISSAQDKMAKFEYAIVKWDGPDRLYYNLPNKFEIVHLEKTGVTIPKEADAEQYCLAAAANVMAKDGWEPINLDSRRILFRRSLMNANGSSTK
jgi:hypothetical protein